MSENVAYAFNGNLPKIRVVDEHSVQGKIADAEIFIRQAFQEDTKKGYELLFRRYHRALCSHAVRFVYSKEVAEDIVGDVFLTFWKNQVQTNITTSFRSYLYASVRNRAYNYLQWEFKNDSDIDEIPESVLNQILEETPQSMLQYDELFHKIEKSITTLPPQCQRVFLMSRFENKKNKEIAEELEIALKTVEAHIMKALSQMRKSLDGYLVSLLIFLISR
ncbi:MAG: RNA polymerase sigma-70 factor [Bacteroidota bacterium]|jgi:RNA polymerase sigma-70 factor (ECF subfamily)